MCDIRKETCVIIRKNGKYLVGKILGSRNELRWADDPYSAWRTRDREQAEKVARAVGGITILFNPIVKQMRAL